MEETLKLPIGIIPRLPPKDVPARVIEAWRAKWRLDLHRRGLLAKILDDPNRVPRGPRFRLCD
jgi:hypothetical protein